MIGIDTEKPFQLEEQQRNGLTVLSAVGPMELIELRQLQSTLARLFLEGRRRVIVDFSEVTTLSSLVVSGFIFFAESFQAGGGEMAVTGASRSLAEVFGQMNAYCRINQQTDVPAAIKAMSTPPAGVGM
ncbi:MAG TPA: STAS domain-containing protein [Verrucomicrobiae bacterium]|nr:STAS domain-containing protein [Verrucomicrobiae bacterium]